MTKKSDLMPGTLDMMILKTLTRGAAAWLWDRLVDQTSVGRRADG